MFLEERKEVLQRNIMCKQEFTVGSSEVAGRANLGDITTKSVRGEGHIIRRGDVVQYEIGHATILIHLARE
jgi:hypothetical protein